MFYNSTMFLGKNVQVFNKIDVKQLWHHMEGSLTTHDKVCFSEENGVFVFQFFQRLEGLRWFDPGCVTGVRGWICWGWHEVDISSPIVVLVLMLSHNCRCLYNHPTKEKQKKNAKGCNVVKFISILIRKLLKPSWLDSCHSSTLRILTFKDSSCLLKWWIHWVNFTTVWWLTRAPFEVGSAFLATAMAHPSDVQNELQKSHICRKDVGMF